MRWVGGSHVSTPDNAFCNLRREYSIAEASLAWGRALERTWSRCALTGVAGLLLIVL